MISMAEKKERKEASTSGMGGNLLIPVDFSEASVMAVEVGFHFASVLQATPVILHAYPEMMFGDNYSPDEYIGAGDPLDDELLEAMEQKDVRKIAEHRFAKFRHKIKLLQEKGEMPDVKFSSQLLPGIAEEVILEYCRSNNPRLVVMSTRGKEKKENDLIGSVTAEVLDSSRVPVFTVPDNLMVAPGFSISRVLMFCTLDQYDKAGLDKLMETFNRPDLEIWLLPMTRHDPAVVAQKMKTLYEQLNEAWPDIRFHLAESDDAGVNREIDGFISRNHIQLVIAPNRKMSIFTRLFRPSVAHQCLFSVDVPMLALPVSR